MRVGLKVLLPFSVQKVHYAPGQFVPDEAYHGWDQVALSNRLNNGYVKWLPVPEGEEPEAAADIDALDKAGLIEYAKQAFGADLDKRVSLDNLRQQVKSIKERMDLMASRDAQGRAAQGARSGESAAKVGGGSSSASSGPAKVTDKGKAKPVDPPATGEQGSGTDPNAGGDGTDGAGTGAGDTGGGDGTPPL